MRRVALVTVAFVLTLLVTGRPAGAQTSPYVPLDDPAYAYIEALQARGALGSLSSLERPLTVAAIRKALAGEADKATSAVLRSWMRRLSHTIARYSVPTTGDSAAGFGYLLAGGLRGVAQTSGQRELMRADSRNGVFPGATLRGVVAAGRVTAAARLMADNRLRDDPDFFGKTDRFVRGRMEDAYVSAQFPQGELFFGRLSRNWGPAPLQGAHLGSAPYSYDHVYARIGVERLHFSSLLTRLEDSPSLLPSDAASPGRTPTGPNAQRYLAMHRLTASIKRFEIAATESYLYSGVGRGLSLTLSNPLNLYNLAQYNERETGNVAYSLDVVLRTAGPWLGAQLFLDDVQVDSCTVACSEPSSYAATIVAEGLPLSQAHRLFASYTRVSNLVYRTPDPTERFASFRVGLGRAFTDYDEARIGVDLGSLPLATLRVYAAMRRQGEGDYRLPFPVPAQYATTPGFLAGETLRVGRLGLTGAGVAGDFGLSWDVGMNRVRGRGVSVTGVEGRLTIRWEPEWGIIRGATH